MPVFLLAHCYFLSCYFFSYLPTFFFSCHFIHTATQMNCNLFPVSFFPTCPLLLSFLLLFFLLAHCFFFSRHFIHTATQMNCYLFSCFFFSHLPTVTFFPVTFFPTCPLLLSFLLLFFLLLVFLPETVTFFSVTFLVGGFGRQPLYDEMGAAARNIHCYTVIGFW